MTQGLPLSILQLRQKYKEDLDDYIENTVSVNEHSLNTRHRKDSSSKKVAVLWGNVTGGSSINSEGGCSYFALVLEKLMH